MNKFKEIAEAVLIIVAIIVAIVVVALAIMELARSGSTEAIPWSNEVRSTSARIGD